jgi:hypothetical protein
LEQTFQGVLQSFKEISGLDLAVSLDAFDGFLLDFNTIFSSGSGLLTTDDIIMYEFFGLLCSVLQMIMYWMNAGRRIAFSA